MSDRLPVCLVAWRLFLAFRGVATFCIFAAFPAAPVGFSVTVAAAVGTYHALVGVCLLCLPVFAPRCPVPLPALVIHVTLVFVGLVALLLSTTKGTNINRLWIACQGVLSDEDCTEVFRGESVRGES